MYSTESAWSAKLMSMTDGGWPSAAARLMRRPSPRRLILRPSFSEYSSTNSRVVRFDEDILSSAGMSISTLKWPGVGNDGAVLHDFEMFFGEDVLVAGDGAENVAQLCGFGHGHHAESVHGGFERFRRIDFGDDDFGAVAAGAAGEAAAAPSVAGDHEFRSGEQEVGRADDAVDGGLSGAVAIVEQMLGVGVVDGDDGVLQHAFLGHGAQANHAGGGFFSAADDGLERVLTLGVQDA